MSVIQIKGTPETRRICDVCGTRMALHDLTHCGYCKKDICDNCIEAREDNTNLRTPLIYCKACWEIGSEFRPEIRRLNQRINKAYRKWITKCTRHREANQKKEQIIHGKNKKHPTDILFKSR